GEGGRGGGEGGGGGAGGRVGGHREPVDALDRLGDQARDVPGGGRGEQVPEVRGAGCDVLRVGQAGERGQVPVGAVQVLHAERSELGTLPPDVAGDRDRAKRAAVVATAHREHLVGAAGGGGGHQRGLVGLGARVGEEHLGVLDAGQPRQLLGQFHLAADQGPGRGVHDPGGDLALDGVADLGQVVPEHVGEDAAEEVEVGAPGGVGDAAAAPADELQRVLVVQGHPVGQHSVVPVHKISHADQSPARMSGRGPTLCNVISNSPYIM